jgi:PAS domain S-box-containing protein
MKVTKKRNLIVQSQAESKQEIALRVATKELIFQNGERQKRAAELVVANKELLFQNKEKKKRALELIVATKELIFHKEQKADRAAELIVANKEKGKRAAELILANKELAFQNEEKEDRAAELLVANKELAFQTEEKAKRAAELIIANKELVFQNEEKDKRAAELIIATIANRDKRKKDEEYIGHLAAIVESSEDAIISKSLNGIIKSWNKGGEKMFGYTAKEAVGKHISLIIPSAYIGEEEMLIEQIRSNEIVTNYETVRCHKNGKQFYVSLTVSPLKDRAGNITGISKIVRDITLRKNAESNLIRANKDLIFENQEKGNRAAELIIANHELVYQSEEKEKRATELVAANKELAFQNKEKENRATELVIANKELVFQNEEKKNRAAELIVANRELVFQNEEKEKRAAELIIANNELAFQNEEKGRRAVELDIAINEWKKLEEQFRLVVEYAPHAMVLVNDDGLITLINKQTENLFGYNRNELIAKKIKILIPEQINMQCQDQKNVSIGLAQRSLMSTDNTCSALRKDGSEIYVEIGFNPIETAKGDMVLASIIDITERKIQEGILKKQNKELEQFAYITSHDLQEPLRTVSNYMKVFGEDYVTQLDSQALSYLASVNNAINRMSTLIRSLLDFSRLNLGKTFAFLDCKRVIGDVIADLDAMIIASNSNIDVGEMPSLNLYETEIRQMFQNLISNSIKFHREGIPPEIQIRAEKLGEKWKFSVRDNGIGIAPAHFERMFDIFQRLHEKDVYEGNGIGLANCKKIAQLHKGEIWVESVIGEGTTIFFTISNLAL